jgi:hypothetical protein
MRRRLACALGLALLVAAGCESLDSLSLSFLGGSSPERECTLSGSVDSVSRSAEALLKDLHLEATASKEGTSVRISSRTAAGQKFALLITPTSDGRTRVRIEWDGKPDDSFGLHLLAQVEYMPGL